MLHGKDTNEVINDFVMSHSMDWLVVAPHHYSFLESIFHKSHTVAMIHISKVPLLSIHE
jgi:nucleotide-binding universal stress UspA family protein